MWQSILCLSNIHFHILTIYIHMTVSFILEVGHKPIFVINLILILIWCLQGLNKEKNSHRPRPPAPHPHLSFVRGVDFKWNTISEPLPVLQPFNKEKILFNFFSAFLSDVSPWFCFISYQLIYALCCSYYKKCHSSH